MVSRPELFFGCHQRSIAIECGSERVVWPDPDNDRGRLQRFGPFHLTAKNANEQPGETENQVGQILRRITWAQPQRICHRVTGHGEIRRLGKPIYSPG